MPLKVRYRPTVRIASEVDQVSPGTTVKLKIRTIRGKIAKVWWNFDGSGEIHSTDESPSYTFDLEKIYDVSLLVEDEHGQQSRVMHKLIRVRREPAEDTELDFDSLKSTAPVGGKKGAIAEPTGVGCGKIWARGRARAGDLSPCTAA